MWLFGEGFGDRHCSLETVSSFLDSALRNREMQRVEAHLASCSDCAQHAEEVKAVVGVLRMMPTEPARGGGPLRQWASERWLPQRRSLRGGPLRWSAFARWQPQRRLRWRSSSPAT